MFMFRNSIKCEIRVLYVHKVSNLKAEHFESYSIFELELKSLLRQGLSEPEFYGDLVYKLKKIVGPNKFSAQFIKISSHYKKIGYNINATDCMLRGQHNHGLQLCFPL